MRCKIIKYANSGLIELYQLYPAWLACSIAFAFVTIMYTSGEETVHSSASRVRVDAVHVRGLTRCEREAISRVLWFRGLRTRQRECLMGVEKQTCDLQMNAELVTQTTIAWQVISGLLWAKLFNTSNKPRVIFLSQLKLGVLPSYELVLVRFFYLKLFSEPRWVPISSLIPDRAALTLVSAFNLGDQLFPRE